MSLFPVHDSVDVVVSISFACKQALALDAISSDLGTMHD